MTRSTTVAGICTLVVCGLAWGGAKVAPESNGNPVIARAESKPAIQSADDPWDVRDFAVLTSPFTPVTPQPVGNGAASVSSPMEAVSVVRLADGQTIHAGKLIPAGATVVRGVVRNRGPQAIDIRSEDVTWRVGAGDVMIVRTTSSCDAKCPSGSFACCNVIDGTAVCGCSTAGASCQSGGEGALSCSISFTD